ncbi:hypothetical protein Tco_1309044, partial [Tanacetum coccineum]
MNDMSHGQSQSKRQSQMSASNMQLPTQLVLSAVMDAVSEGPSQTYVSNHMQFQQHNLNSMRNDQSGRYPTPATHISIIPTASTGTVIGVRKQQFYNYHIDQHQTVAAGHSGERSAETAAEAAGGIWRGGDVRRGSDIR